MARIYNKEQLADGNPNKLAELIKDEERLNQLHKFRTYAYHHILVVANTTGAAERSVGGNEKDTDGDLRDMLHKSRSTKYEPVKHTDGGSYIVLINGMTDAEFLIQGLEIEMILDPSAGESNPHAAFVEGTLEIAEPRGVHFLNILKTACDKLECDPLGLHFVLKTVFVGYTDGQRNSPHIEQIINVAPFHFNITDLTAEFSATGSNYHMSFVGTVNGSSRMPVYSTIQQSNISGSTIKEAIDKLVLQLNDSTRKSQEVISQQLDERNNANKISGKDYSPTGRRVNYVIDVHPDFKNLPLDNVNHRNRSSAGVAQLATPQGIDIESAISDIMFCSKTVVEMLNKDIKSGFKNIFKVESTVESTMDSVTITYVVKKCKVPVYIKDNVDNEGTLIDPYISNRPVLEFDYIFTGRNTEVLEYDMKMVMGLAFFQSFGSTNNLPGSFHLGSGDITIMPSGSGTALNDKTTIMRKLTPMPALATMTDQDARNKIEPSQTGDFRTFMARQAALESVASKIVIVGIPWLLGAFNQSLQEASNPNTPSLKETVPLIKMLVHMPTLEENFLNGNNYTEEFWYDGYFHINTIRHIFRDGKFTQELDLIALPSEEMVKPTTVGAAPSKRKASEPPTNNTGAVPRVSTPTTKTDKSTKNSPVITAEQKVKLGEKAESLTKQELLNCQTIKSARPITMDSARRTKLTNNITLFDLIRRPVNLPFLSDTIIDRLCLLAKKLEQVENLLGHKITITSGYRCPAYNSSTPGSSKTSDHMRAIACDFVCPQFGSTMKIYEALKSSGIDVRQVIRERDRARGGDGWIHISFNIDGSAPPIKVPKFSTMDV